MSREWRESVKQQYRKLIGQTDTQEPPASPQHHESSLVSFFDLYASAEMIAMDEPAHHHEEYKELILNTAQVTCVANGKETIESNNPPTVIKSVLVDHVPEVDERPLITPHSRKIWGINIPGHMISAHENISSFVIKYKGVLLMVVANALFFSMSLAVKLISKLGDPIPPFEIVFARGVMGSLICIGCMRYLGVQEMWGPLKIRHVLIARGIFGFLGLSANFSALRYIQLSDFTAISFLAPLFTAILATCALNEKMHWVDGVSSLFSITGVILVSKPSFIYPSSALNSDSADSGGGQTGDDLLIPERFNATSISSQYATNTNGTTSSSARNSAMADAEQTFGILLCLFACLMAAGALISIRMAASKATHPLHSVFYHSFVSIPAGLFVITCIPTGVLNQPWVIPRHVSTWSLLCLVSCSGFAGQICMSIALKTEKAAKASSISYVQLVFAFLTEWLAWNQVPDAQAVIGCLLIGCMIVLVIRK